MKIGRNQICPLCDSGKKYKKCCGNPLLKKSHLQSLSPSDIPVEAKEFIERHKANELIREQQQGLGNRIVSLKDHGHQIVAVGNTLYSSPNWETFPDFLSGFLKSITTAEWGNAVIKKPFEERHPILQWYDQYCRYQKLYKINENKISSGPMIGVVNCYLGLAYNLYLLKHNVELQERFIQRIKHLDQFQGAYYELIVANTLIRAGFTLELEDEVDDTTKHCEFSATSSVTGKKYWVEAKMRVLDGVLGNGKNTGIKRKKNDPTSRLTAQLKDALNKPADGERLIFIDVNTPSKNDKTMPDWINQAIRRLDDKEQNLKKGQSAYVFVTNVPFHHHLENERVELAIYAHGLGMSDFSKPGKKRLTQIYLEKQKHIDAYNIVECFRKYPHIPQNFEGSLSANTNVERLIIGESYFFKNLSDEGVVGEVIRAIVSEGKKQIYCVVQTQDGKNQIITKPMSDEELEDYNNHPEAFFGKVQHVGKTTEDPYELFEFFISTYKETPKSCMLELFKEVQDIDYLKSLDDEALLLECCESLVSRVAYKK